MERRIRKFPQSDNNRSFYEEIQKSEAIRNPLGENTDIEDPSAKPIVNTSFVFHFEKLSSTMKMQLVVQTKKKFLSAEAGQETKQWSCWSDFEDL